MNLAMKAPDTTRLASETDKLQALASLATLPAQRSFSAEQDEINDRAMMQALDGVSRYSLMEAVKSILRGALGHTFFPTPVELRLACDRAQQPIRDMQRRISITEENRRDRDEFNRINAQKTPEARARVAALLAKLDASFETSRREEEEAARAEIRARYGIEGEALAKVPDQPAPSNFRRIA